VLVKRYTPEEEWLKLAEQNDLKLLKLMNIDEYDGSKLKIKASKD